MEQVAIFIKVKAKPGQREEIRRLWESHLKDRVTASQSQQVYFFCFDKEDENTLCLFEYYNDSSVMEQNAKSVWFAKYMEQVGPLLDGWPEVTTLEPIWAKPVELG